MKKSKIINELNKVLKSKSSKISQSDRRKLRTIIKDIEQSKKVDWKLVILNLFKLIGFGTTIYKELKE